MHRFVQKFVPLVAIGALVGFAGTTGVGATPLQPLPASAHTYGADVFTYSGDWERVERRDGRFHGTSTRSFRSGARAMLRFQGTAFTLYGVIGSRGGLGLVVVDGRPAYVMNFYGPTKLTHHIVYTSPQLAPGTHRVMIRTLPDLGSPGRYVNLDGVDVR